MTYHRRRRPLLGCLLSLGFVFLCAIAGVAFWVLFIKWVISL